MVKTVGAPLDNYWTGAVDNDLSNDANWSSGTKPTGNANIFCATPATLTKGTFVATNYTFTGAGQMWFGGYLGNTASVTANANAVLKVGRVDLTSSGALWLHGYSGSDNNKIYIGADGINLSGTGYIGVENSGHSPTLWPWNSDYTIGIGSNSSYDLRLGSASDKGNINLTLQTDDEAGVPRTVTLAARVYTEMSTSSITVAGHGTNIVTSLSSGMTGTYSLTDSATAIFNAGAGFGDGSTISLGAGTTLEYTRLRSASNLTRQTI